MHGGLYLYGTLDCMGKRWGISSTKPPASGQPPAPCSHRRAKHWGRTSISELFELFFIDDAHAVFAQQLRAHALAQNAHA